MKTLKLILIIVSLSVSNLHAQIKMENLPCKWISNNHLTDLSGFGDSRASQMDNYLGYAQPINTDNKIQGNAIENAVYPSNSLNRILEQNVTSVTSRSMPGSTTEDWYKKIKGCGKYDVTPHTFISLGGNDLINILVAKELLLTEYQALQFQKLAEDYLNIALSIYTRKITASRQSTFQKVINQGLQKLNDMVNTFKNFVNNPLQMTSRCLQSGAGFTLIIPVIGSFLDVPNGLNIVSLCDPPLLSFHNYWQWRSDYSVDLVVKNMDFITRSILSQSPGHQILINTIAPPALPKLDQMKVDLLTPPDGLIKVVSVAKNYPDALKLFLSLNLKYFTNILPGLWRDYTPKKVIFLDTVPTFWGNIIDRNVSSDYYIWDGIHFTDKGRLVWGRMIANAMVQWKWYQAGAGYQRTLPEPKYYSDTTVNWSHTNTMIRGLDDSVPINAIIDRELQLQDNAFKKEFPEINATYFTRHDDPTVYKVQNEILRKYKALGEANNGGIGAPLSDELCYGPGPTCINRVSYFDSGAIHYDPFFGTNYSQFVVYPPASTYDSAPDFITCVSSPCGSRWFDFNEYQLQATSGTPPYLWNIVSGTLPVGTVLFENGTIYKPPTNNPNGTWTAKVQLTDSLGKTVLRAITLTSGL